MMCFIFFNPAVNEQNRESTDESSRQPDFDLCLIHFFCKAGSLLLNTHTFIQDFTRQRAPQLAYWRICVAT